MRRRRRDRAAGTPRPVPASLSAGDTARTAFAGLRTRPGRVVLSALGIAIGIATMTAVLGVSASSRADLMRRLDALGTNLLTAEAGDTLFGGKARLPKESPGMVGRIPGVRDVGATGLLDVAVRRTGKVPEEETGGLSVRAATEGLPRTLRAGMRSGTWLNAANSRYPAVVLGSVAAQRLGVTSPGEQVWIEDRYFTVVGILDALPLAPEIERSALVGWDGAARLLGFDGHPTTIYERSAEDRVRDVAGLLAATINPRNPEEVRVGRPSDALAARAAAGDAFTSLLLGLGAVALLVGGVGVANTMIISVLERRHEIGLRRSLGATRGQIRVQFVMESLLLSALGGLAGAVLGVAATYAFALARGMPFALPPWSVGAGLGATLLIGTVAGLYPAIRAARLSPTLALHAA
ncbi:ABC transporter permease [Bailinhaonella thermotolerans]|uniref:ABC transporter permease n=1 Tax=Bailinhaonella thermotolerans TaxID=1070861 RepID=A0A3A4AKG8_9ACTN|nr:ABC transporter permease [Bailinhaonella thermotolerans]RJL30146.1 ABC transporter permease [Bailinhaonella thermotolerans]